MDQCRVHVSNDLYGSNLALDVDPNALLNANDPFASSMEARGFPSPYCPVAEFQRQGINEAKRWQYIGLNRSFRLCPTYGRLLVVPKAVEEKIIKRASKWRSRCRIPVLTWLHPTTGAALCRSSQPMTGIGINNACPEDEQLLTEIRKTADLGSPASRTKMTPNSSVATFHTLPTPSPSPVTSLCSPQQRGRVVDNNFVQRSLFAEVGTSMVAGAAGLFTSRSGSEATSAEDVGTVVVDVPAPEDDPLAGTIIGGEVLALNGGEGPPGDGFLILDGGRHREGVQDVIGVEEGEVEKTGDLGEQRMGEETLWVVPACGTATSAVGIEAMGEIAEGSSGGVTPLLMPLPAMPTLALVEAINTPVIALNRGEGGGMDVGGGQVGCESTVSGGIGKVADDAVPDGAVSPMFAFSAVEALAGAPPPHLDLSASSSLCLPPSPMSPSTVVGTPGDSVTPRMPDRLGLKSPSKLPLESSLAEAGRPAMTALPPDEEGRLIVEEDEEGVVVLVPRSPVFSDSPPKSTYTKVSMERSISGRGGGSGGGISVTAGVPSAVASSRSHRDRGREGKSETTGGRGWGRQAVLRIVDARPMISAKGHLILGKGHEVISRLGGSQCATLAFLEIPNIHVMRDSLLSMMSACCSQEEESWLQQLHVS
ncbi:unnamed protein product [Choristocarpus tenellus]